MRGGRLRGFEGLALALVLSGSGPAAAQELGFLRDGEAPIRVALTRLVAECEPSVVRVSDPYYAREKRFHALPLSCVLALGFGAAPAADADVLLRARDGYTRPAPAGLLADAGAWLAFADADLSAGDPRSPDFVPVWEPIDRRELDPAPFYLIWSGPEQNDPHRYPWPYQLAELEIAPLARLYPHIEPPAGNAAARRGFAIFRAQCIHCHAMNREGGTVGPDLNVPRSIVEYRPVEQIKAYIRDPQSFRYTSMPSHEHLGDSELDALVAYFEAMSHAKHDPGGRAP